MSGLMGLILVGVDPVNLGPGNQKMYDMMSRRHKLFYKILKKHKMKKLYEKFLNDNNYINIWTIYIDEFQNYLIYKKLLTPELNTVFDNFKKLNLSYFEKKERFLF